MIDLIKRLEEAREPTRELDAEIWCRINRPHYQLGTAIEWKRGRPKTPPNWMRAYGLFNGYVTPPKCPAYTSSVDAALSLVPEGCFHGFITNGDGHGFDACCERYGPELEWVTAPTPALAICIASLRAKEVEDEQ